MQSCVIDGQVRDFNLSGADSLASMLNSLNGDLAASGRFVASLRLNGREVADIDQESRGREPECHHRNQALTAGNGLGLATMLGE